MNNETYKAIAKALELSMKFMTDNAEPIEYEKEMRQALVARKMLEKWHKEIRFDDYNSLSRWTDDRKYTMGMCYALCEFLETLTRDSPFVIADICDVLGYETNFMIDLLRKLDSDINNVICDEQDKSDYSEQMAQIMKIEHIKGDNDDE